MRELDSVELHAVSGGAVAVEIPGKVIHRRIELPEQAHFDHAPPDVWIIRPPRPVMKA